MAKLTLTVDEVVIERAKQYAAEHGTSISDLVECYLALIVDPPVPDTPTPILDRWRGIAAGAYPDAESAVRDYHRHLEEKHR